MCNSGANHPAGGNVPPGASHPLPRAEEGQHDPPHLPGHHRQAGRLHHQQGGPDGEPHPELSAPV